MGNQEKKFIKTMKLSLSTTWASALIILVINAMVQPSFCYIPPECLEVCKEDYNKCVDVGECDAYYNCAYMDCIPHISTAYVNCEDQMENDTPPNECMVNEIKKAM